LGNKKSFCINVPLDEWFGEKGAPGRYRSVLFSLHSSHFVNRWMRNFDFSPEEFWAGWARTTSAAYKQDAASETGLTGRSAKSMSNIVSISSADLELTAAEVAELRETAQLTDSTIDYSDIPATTQADWSDAVPNGLYRPIKKQISLRLDADILAWARNKGERGYQSRLNAILRQAMVRDLQSKQKNA
jgi:uncharacterized protein (DUF4415 family)